MVLERLLRAMRRPSPAPPAAADVDARTSRQRDGDEGEAIARRHLEAQGLVFVERNLRYRDGELDLVMRDDARTVPLVVFVEVRRRSRAAHASALESVTWDKRRRVVAAASRYLTSLDLRTPPPCRIDVVTLDGDGDDLAIRWHRDAFRAGS